MGHKVLKVNLIPVRKNQEVGYLLDQTLKLIAPIRKLIDDYGSQYIHETPWNKKFLEDPKFYLYRAKLGIVGRITNCEDAIRLGLVAKIPAQSCHFTCMALYHIYRIARQQRRQFLYLKQLNVWMNNFIQDKNVNSRFLSTYNLECS